MSFDRLQPPQVAAAGSSAVRVAVLVRATVLIWATVLAQSTASAAQLELAPWAGYRGGGEVELVDSGSTVDLGGAASFGLTLGFPTRDDGRIEAIWTHQDSEFTPSGTGVPAESFGLHVDSLHLGGVYEPDRESGPRPFVLFSAGLTRFDPEPSGFGPETEVSFAIGGGASLPLSSRLAVRLLGRFWFTIQDATFSGVCGGSACTFRLAASGAVQGEIAAGLVFRLGRGEPAERARD